VGWETIWNEVASIHRFSTIPGVRNGLLVVYVSLAVVFELDDFIILTSRAYH